MKFIYPNKKYLQSYFEACVGTWEHVHDEYILHNPNKYSEWQNTIFDEYKNNMVGKNLPDGFVPSITYWLIDKNEYIGTVNIRPQLNAALKKYGGHCGCVVRYNERGKGYGRRCFQFMFNKSLQLGIKDLLITCEESNLISQKNIENLNPVRMEKDVIDYKKGKTQIRRYYF